MKTQEEEDELLDNEDIVEASQEVRIRRNRNKPLSLLGRYLYAICAILAISEPQLARIAELSRTRLSELMRPLGENRYPLRETVEILCGAIARMAEERRVSLPYGWLLGLRCAAWGDMQGRQWPDVLLADLEDMAREAQRERGEKVTIPVPTMTPEELKASRRMFRQFLRKLDEMERRSR